MVFSLTLLLFIPSSSLSFLFHACLVLSRVPSHLVTLISAFAPPLHRKTLCPSATLLSYSSPPSLSLLSFPPLHHPFFTNHPFVLLLAVSSHPSLQCPSTAAARRLTFSPQHQQRRVGPYQLLQRGGHPQHVPRGPAAGCPGPAELRLPRRARLPVAVAWQQPGPEDTRRHGDFQQVHVEVCTQVSSPGNTQKRGQGD